MARLDLTIIGTIQIAAHDVDGSILAVNLCTDDGRVFLIEDNKKGEVLTKHVGRRATLKGLYRKDEGLHLLSVDQFFLF